MKKKPAKPKKRVELYQIPPSVDGLHAVMMVFSGYPKDTPLRELASSVGRFADSDAWPVELPTPERNLVKRKVSK